MQVIRDARARLNLADTIDTSAYASFTELLIEGCKKNASAPAFTALSHTMTFSELDELSNNLASYLQNEAGLVAGDRVALQLPNMLQYPVALLGVLKAGMVVVNTNPLYSVREMVHQFNDSGAKALIVLANVAADTAKALPDTGIEKVILTEAADLHPLFKRVLINFVAKHVKKLIPTFEIANTISLRKALSLGSKKAHVPSSANFEDVAMLQYTGGTTGLSKGAMLSHGNLVSNLMQFMTMTESYGFTDGGEVNILPLPLYHIYACILAAMGIHRGDHGVLIPNPRDIDGFIKTLDKHKFSTFAGLNTLFVGLCAHDQFKKLDFSNLKVTFSGGMALTNAAAVKWQEVTGCDIYEGYGMTETSPLVSSAPANGNKRGTIGLPVAATEIKIVDDEGNALGVDQPGELCVRGPQVMLGYWNRPDATAETIDSEGWLFTGDVAQVGEDGYIRIVDRKKNMIIVSGFNVFPNEVEDILCNHEDVLEAAVIGVPDEIAGEAIKAFIVTAKKDIDFEVLRAYCKENLAGYKVPRAFELRDDLPKSAVGKILHRELREN
jgi:long-chain acyl-CoA synthetase